MTTKPNKPPTTAPAIAPIDDPESFDGRSLLLGAIVGKSVNDDQDDEEVEDADSRESFDGPAAVADVLLLPDTRPDVAAAAADRKEDSAPEPSIRVPQLAFLALSHSDCCCKFPLAALMHCPNQNWHICPGTVKLFVARAEVMSVPLSICNCSLVTSNLRSVFLVTDGSDGLTGLHVLPLACPCPPQTSVHVFRLA